LIHLSLVIPQTEWLCRCGDEIPHTASCCCNCPKCVEKRDGLLSFCNISGSTGKKEGQGHFLESMGCACGIGRTVLHLPADSPYLPIDLVAAPPPARRPAHPSPVRGILPDAAFSIIQPPG